MASNSRRAKPIDVGSRETPAVQDSCAGSHGLVVGATPSPDASKELGSNLPAWMNKRYADASKSVRREDTERSGSSEEFMTVPEAASADCYVIVVITT